MESFAADSFTMDATLLMLQVGLVMVLLAAAYLLFMFSLAIWEMYKVCVVELNLTPKDHVPAACLIIGLFLLIGGTLLR